MQHKSVVIPTRQVPGNGQLQKSNLPVQPTPLIGREKEMAAIQQLLLRQDMRLFTLTGPGGIGKTRLGLQVAAELSELFPDGVYFVNLAPISDSAFVVPSIAQVLDLKETGEQPLLDLLKTYLREKQLLLLLDNFEQVVSAAIQVADLLTACPQLKVVVTSRAVLHVRGEQEFDVPPLALPDPRHLPDLETLSQYEAVALFIWRAQAVKPEFRLSDANASAIAEICVHMDGLPLAIELAAARIKLLPPQALLARLGQLLQLLTSGAQDAPARQQTLWNTIKWSYDLLNAQEQRLFRRLSVFVGGCTLEAIEAVCHGVGDDEIDVLNTVSSLIDKSLVQQRTQRDEEPRLVLLETIREYGLECLAESGETEAMQEAHALYYLALAEQAEPHLKGAEQGQWFVRLEQERDNLRAVLTWLLEAATRGRGEEKGRRQAERALRLGVALYWFWYTAGPPSEGRSFLDRALSVGAVVATPLRARALFATSDLVWAMGDLDRAQKLAEESLRLCQELRDTGGIANALMMLQGVAWLRNQYSLARSYLEEAEALFREVGDTWSRGQCLTQLAQISTAQGEYVRARTLLEESRGLYSTLGDQRRLSFVFYLLARVLFLSQGDLAEARALAEQSLALNREFKETWIRHEALYLLGKMHLYQGELALARELFEASLATGKETQWDRVTTVMAQIGLVRVLVLQGEGEVARPLCQRSLALVRDIGHKDCIATCLEDLGAVGVVQGQPAWAARLWGAAEALRQHIGAPLPPVYRADYERSVAAARTHLGEKPFAVAWAQGRTMTPEQALATEGQPLLPTPIPSARPAATYPDGLTAREIEVLRLLAQGMTSAQIAERLVIGVVTVNFHVRSIYSKLGVTSRSAATRYALEHYLV